MRPIAIACAVLAAACGGPAPPTGGPAGEIAFIGIHPVEGLGSLCSTVETSDCPTVAFNPHAAVGPDQLTVVAINPSPDPVALSWFNLSGDAGFEVVDAPELPVELAPATFSADGLRFVVRAAPTPSAQTAILAFETDATNAPAGIVHLPLLSAASSFAALVAASSDCDLRLPVGTTATCSVVLANEGDRELVITSIALDAAFATPMSVFFLPTFIQPGQGISFSVSLTAAAGVQTGELLIETNDFGQPTTVVRLRVEGT